MKATFDIPDDLYRRANARSAMEGRALRSVAVELFQNWLASRPQPNKAEDEDLTEPETAQYPWLEITRHYIRPDMSHDLDEMKEAAARGWGDEMLNGARLSEHSK